MQKLDIQLKDGYLRRTILGSGGKALITPAGKYVKAILRSAAGSQEANGKTLVAGHLSSYVDNVVWAQLAFDGQTANFTAGSILTGAQSGATGLIKSQTDAGATGTLTLIGLTGQFVDDEAITDAAGGAALVNGQLSGSIFNVDVYMQAPSGHFIVVGNVSPLGLGEIFVNQSDRRQLMQIPFSIYDTAAATETDTSFDLPAACMVLDRLHGCGVWVTAIDATEDIDVGTGEVTPAETGGDANGLIAASDMDVLGNVVGTNGALFSTNAPYKSDANAAKSITYTLTAGSDTGEGIILLPIVLTGLPFAYS